MSSILTTFVIIIGIMVFASILNEKKLHIPHDIALLLISFLIAVLILVLNNFNFLPFMDSVSNIMKNVKLDSFVLECALGFIMFASASKIHLTKFVKNLLPIRCTICNNDFCFFDSLWRFIFLSKFSIKFKHRNMDLYYFTVRYFRL